jgi:hypothetical protein
VALVFYCGECVVRRAGLAAGVEWTINFRGPVRDNFLLQMVETYVNNN